MKYRPHDPERQSVWAPVEARPGVTIPLTMLIGLVVLGLLVIGVSASRPGPDNAHPPDPAEVPPALDSGSSSEGPMYGPTTPTLAAPTPAPEGEIGDPLVAVKGKATWYCASGSACTRGYGPSDLVAAIDRKDTPWDKGDRVVVRSGSKHVTVRIVDVCACGGSRIIDLSSGAFRRLAPLSRGVITVTVETASASVAPPATDMDHTTRWRVWPDELTYIFWFAVLVSYVATKRILGRRFS